VTDLPDEGERIEKSDTVKIEFERGIYAGNVKNKPALDNGATAG
jgi:hypothetical protein